MHRIILATALSSIATAAIAHPGHIEMEAGHAHYVVVGALIAAVAIAVFAFRKFKSTSNV